MRHVIVTPSKVFECRNKNKHDFSDGSICHDLPESHDFFNTPENGYFDIVNNFPEAPSIRLWTQEEIDAHEASLNLGEAE